jgi:hypothetical protein
MKTTARSQHDTPPPQPCYACQGTQRWNDAGIWRCRACWPTPLTTQARKGTKKWAALYWQEEAKRVAQAETETPRNVLASHEAK